MREFSSHVKGFNTTTSEAIEINEIAKRQNSYLLSERLWTSSKLIDDDKEIDAVVLAYVKNKEKFLHELIYLDWKVAKTFVNKRYNTKTYILARCPEMPVCEELNRNFPKS